MKYLIAIAMALACFLSAQAQATILAYRLTAIHKMETDTLARLYEEMPDTQNEIRDAAGYAVFSSGELGVPWTHPGYGHGIAHDNKSQKDTYMELVNAPRVLGPFNIVFVFQGRDAFRSFVTTGLDLSGTNATTALAGVRVYQLTAAGLLDPPVIQGSQYKIDYTMPHTPEPGEIVGSTDRENTP